MVCITTSLAAGRSIGICVTKFGSWDTPLAICITPAAIGVVQTEIGVSQIPSFVMQIPAVVMQVSRIVSQPAIGVTLTATFVAQIALVAMLLAVGVSQAGVVVMQIATEERHAGIVVMHERAVVVPLPTEVAGIRGGAWLVPTGAFGVAIGEAPGPVWMAPISEGVFCVTVGPTPD